MVISSVLFTTFFYNLLGGVEEGTRQYKFLTELKYVLLCSSGNKDLLIFLFTSS